jgi:hypothetical protein
LQKCKEDIHHLLSKMAGFDSTLGGGFRAGREKLDRDISGKAALK